MTRTPVPAPDQPATSTTALAAMTGSSNLPVAIDIDLLRPHPKNPRRDLGDLTELVDSIRAHGVRQNGLVVPDPDVAGAYRLVIGHRRTAAARLAGKTQLLVVVDETLSEADQLALMLLENVQRSDLSAVEEADAYQGLLDLGLDEAAIAERTGRSRATVKSRLRLVTLPEQARQAVHTHTATLADAAALDEFTDPEVRDRLAEALGDRDFQHAVTLERRRQQMAKDFKPVLDALARGNATELTRDTWQAPDGLVRAFEVIHHYLTSDADHAKAAITQQMAALEQMGPGWAWSWYYSNAIQVFRPPTLEESTAAAERAEQMAAVDAQRAAEREQFQAQRAAQEAAAAARKELAEVTASTRREFLEHLIHDRKLTAAQTAALVRFAGFEILLDGWLDAGGETTGCGPEQVLSWLRIDTDAIAARAADEELDADDALDQETRQALAAMEPANRLLAALAAANEPVEGYSFTSRSTAAWYALLEDLGYALSEAERVALHPAADVEAA